jgi:hypothetical protein
MSIRSKKKKICFEDGGKQVPPKYLYISTRLHGVRIQKTFFNINLYWLSTVSDNL